MRELQPQRRSLRIRSADGVASWLFRAISRDPAKDIWVQPDRERVWKRACASDERWLSRMPQELNFEGASVLDFGCGIGSMVILAAQRGARRAVGVDIQSVASARTRVERDYPELADRVAFRQVAPDEDLGDEQFDFVISKNSFEHVDDPPGFVEAMKKHLAPGGRLLIGFGPLWKAPSGGHIGYMTNLPWAHLIFPERVILRERRRYRPDEDPQRFEEVRGGLNRMTLARFRETMAASGLEARYWAVNRHEHPAVKVADWLRRIPGLEEYFAFSVHTVWQRPEPKLELESPERGAGVAPV